MIQQKATVEFDGKSKLTISGELLPASPGVHDALTALLSEAKPPKATVEYKTQNNVVTYSLTFEAND